MACSVAAAAVRSSMCLSERPALQPAAPSATRVAAASRGTRRRTGGVSAAQYIHRTAAAMTAAAATAAPSGSQ